MEREGLRGGRKIPKVRPAWHTDGDQGQPRQHSETLFQIKRINVMCVQCILNKTVGMQLGSYGVLA